MVQTRQKDQKYVTTFCSDWPSVPGIVFGWGFFFYNTGRYHKVQDIIKLCSHRLSQPYILFDDPDLDKCSQQNLECFCMQILGNQLNNV